MSDRADQWAEITSWFSRHLVCLECTYTVLHTSRKPESVRTYFSGFLLWLKGRAFWVTAGHCIESIDQTILGRPDVYTNVSFRLIDTLHRDTTSDLPPPFRYTDIRYHPYLWHKDANGEELGWDYGAIMLPEHHVRMLAANNVIPIEEQNWVNVPTEFDLHLMLGVPAQRVDKLSEDTYNVAPTLLPVDLLDDRPPQYSAHTDPMIYARVRHPGINDIAGMSGGPILGFKSMPDGRLRYWVVGVQSGWVSSRRELCASPLKPLWDLLSLALDEADRRRGQDS